MAFLSYLNNKNLESQIDNWRKNYFKLFGLNDPFSTNQGTDKSVSGVVGSVLSAREKERILAKGGLIVPLINRLFCGTDHGIYSRPQILKKYISFIVMRLRILHKCPREPLLNRIIEYHSSDGLAYDFAIDPRSGHVSVITETFFELLNSTTGRRMVHDETKTFSFSNRVAFGRGDDKSILAVCSGNEISIYGVPTVCSTHQNIMMTSGTAKLSCTQEITLSVTVNTVQFSPDGRVLVICLSDRTVRVFKNKQSADGTQEWVCVETLPEQTGEITSVAFCQQPEILILAIGLGDNTIKIWDISSDETKPSSCIDTLHGHSNCVTSVSFHPYLKILASGSDDKTVKVWIPDVNGQFRCMLTLEHDSIVSSVAFSPSGFLVSGGGNIMPFCNIWRIFMSAKRVNAQLVLKQFIEGGIYQLEFCPKTGKLLIRTYNGVNTLE